MQLFDVKRMHPNKRPKPRVGRGGKRGTTSGRGTKGQKSRAGHRIRPAERDFIQRLPKLRGGGRESGREHALIVHTGLLEKLPGAVVNREALRNHGLIPNRWRGPIKILCGGAITKPLGIQGLAVSGHARKMIEAAGGRIE